jgi:hypothetical protein
MRSPFERAVARIAVLVTMCFAISAIVVGDVQHATLLVALAVFLRLEERS